MTSAFFQRSVHEIAPQLIGVELLIGDVGGVIVEVEAYDHDGTAIRRRRLDQATKRVDVPRGWAPLVPELRLR